MCKHENFETTVGVSCLKDSGGFMADIRIKCTQCGTPFQFLGLAPGIDVQGAKVSVDGLEARIALSPEGAKPNPLQRMAFNVKQFDA